MNTIIVSVCLLCLARSAAGAQPPREGPGSALAEVMPVERDTGMGFRLADEHLPLHELVRDIFPMIGFVLESRAQLGVRGAFLKNELGIEEGSEQDEALLRAILAAAEAQPSEAERARRHEELVRIGSTEGDEARRRVYLEQSRADAKRIGEIWGRFVAELGGEQARPMVKVRAFVERRRSSVAMVSNNSFMDPDNYVWMMERAFREGVAEGLQTGQP